MYTPPPKILQNYPQNIYLPPIILILPQKSNYTPKNRLGPPQNYFPK